MATQASDAVTVDLGAMAARVEARVRSGDYASVSEVVRAGLEALEREDAAFEARLRAAVAEALADTRPPIPFAEAMVELRSRIDERRRGDIRD